MKCAVRSRKRFRSSSKARDFQSLFESIDDECSETTMSSRHIPLLPARLALCHFLTKHVAASWWAELLVYARVPAPDAFTWRSTTHWHTTTSRQAQGYRAVAPASPAAPSDVSPPFPLRKMKSRENSLFSISCCFVNAHRFNCINKPVTL